ncbi:enoyl-CoA hydratase/isomerase family protein [Pararobbsia silviterrae]|uniref:3-hydroxyisobutyryl-CoA hydrolase n=1 Tax=Pararobbsia silviterrae TaxID=1792498 RepID=A0A494Y0V7_9BURK|nr:enoyl-CoA hydratase/isomerase family protein [Pararobbsia silviterrae]RKP53493.1 enoyl-CoA hydratase/isomerase family protein [Pararobbsia silviterrae]
MSVSPDTGTSHLASPHRADIPTVLFRTIDRIARITLNRPAALNALDLPMIHAIAARLEQCRADPDIVAVVLDSALDKAFCAGGDVRALLRPGHDTRADLERYFADEYRLDFAIHRFPKPVVAIMDAVTMGGGMGLAQGASLRVATDRSRIAMPETKIGLVPDVGATHFLAAMPIETALYVGLTGVTLSGPDALACGLADVCVPHDTLAGHDSGLDSDLNSGHPSGLDARLARIDTSGTPSFDALRAALQHACAPSASTSGHAASSQAAHAPIARQHAWIAEHFRSDRSPQAIVESLRAARRALPDDTAAQAERDWLDATLSALTAYSPTMIHVTREALLRGRGMTLADSFRMEMGIVIRSIEEGDFREGVRAHLVDKDRAPKWDPATLDAVSRERIEHFMTSPWSPDAHPLRDLGAH